MSEGPAGPRLLRAALVGFAGLGWLLCAATVVVYVRSERALERRHAPPMDAASIPALDFVARTVDPTQSASAVDAAATTDAALLERGRHLVTVVAQCTYCHGPDLGGREMADDPWIGRLHAANLTRGEGGVAARYAASDWEAALRRGIDPQGRSLLLMPSAHLARLSSRDLAAIVAYVRQVPAVDRVQPARRVGWLTRVVVALDLAPDLLSAEQVARQGASERAGSSTRRTATTVSTGNRADRPRVVEDILPAPTPAYGEYLVELASCRVCHRADLAGGLHPLSLPGEPVPPDLTPGGPLDDWNREDFARAMREGKTPDGRALDRAFMPWPAFAGLSDLELDAFWGYLRSLEGGDGMKSDGDPRLARRSDGRSRG